MGFGKAKYDVEEKGLDPKVGHKELGEDGRLTQAADKLEVPEEVVVVAKPSEFAEKITGAATAGIKEEVSQLHNKGIPVVGLDEAGEVVVQDAPEPEEEEEVDESPEKEATPKKTASTKKKTSKK